MTARVDQRVGRDAIERYQVLRKELDAWWRAGALARGSA